MSEVGGTVFIGRTNYVLIPNHDVKVWQSEQYWDGKKPFRITSVDGVYGTLDFQNYNDFLLEDGSRLQGVVAPNAPIKFDNIKLEYCKVNVASQLQNLYGRGNKFVIGENVTTESGKTWKLYGGTEHSNILIQNGRPDVMTNVVVASGDWGYVFGGGEGPTGCGTQVTIRGTANVDNVYGGGERKGSIGINSANEHMTDHGVNVYIEGGNVGNLYGGSAINGSSLITGSHALTVNEDININISGGYTGHIVGGADTTDGSVMDTTTLENSPINGNVTINISAANSVGSVAGDPNRNTPMIASANLQDVRQVKGYTWLNVTASNNFTYFDYFDVVNITGSNVVVSSQAKPGYHFVDNGLTWWGSTTDRDGYIGQIRVAEGAKLVLDHGGVINRPYRHYVTNNGVSSYQDAIEQDRVFRADSSHEWFSLSHSWVGETSEDRRNLSTVAINGQGAGITAASGTAFNDAADVCGLRIYGNVQGEIGEFTNSSWDYNDDVPGYSTLEVNGTPMYSDSQNYYYYIVADSSANGGKAFREPEGAPYIVCYRYLDNGKIGWYLRERPQITMSNKLVRAGDTANGQMSVHVVMNGLAYEWSNVSSNNSVDVQWTKTIGTDGSNLTTVTESLSLSDLANIENDTTGRFSNVVIDTVNGVKYLRSFDYVIDQSTPTEPTYYEAEVDFHVVRNDGGTTYDDIHKANGVNAARCVYDFAGNDDLHTNEGYTDSVMDTFPYSTLPESQDAALLRVYLPYGVTGKLSVLEDDNHFLFTENNSIDAQLVQSSVVTANYASAGNAAANSQFAVTIGGSELSQGISGKNLSSAITKYVCKVYSHKNITIEDISQNTASGLKLLLQVSNLTKDSSSVGNNDPSAVNNGELQIQTLPSTVALIITKQVINAQSSGSFPFEVIIKDSGNVPIVLDRAAIIEDVGIDNNVSIAQNGTISFSLENNQSIRLTGIPISSVFTLSETQHTDYKVIISENGTALTEGDTLSNSRLDRTRKIVVYNSGEYSLPATGKNGINNYIVFGMVFMTLPIIIGFVLRHIRRRVVKK